MASAQASVSAIVQSYKAPLDVLIDDTTFPGFLLVGMADPGTATSSPSWQIAKVDSSKGSKRYCASSQEFKYVWDNRASYTYLI